MPRSEWIVIPNAIPALITEEQFLSVQDKLDSLHRGKANRKPFGANESKTILAKLVKCAKCGRMMDFNSRTKQLGAFKCNMPKRATKFGCTSEKIEERDLVETIRTILGRQIALFDLQQSLKTIQQPVKKKSVNAILTDIQNLKRLIEQAKSTKIDLWENYRDNKITQERFKENSDQLTKQVTAYEAKLEKLDVQIEEPPWDSDNILAKPLTELSGIQELTRELVVEFISEIKVHTPVRIEIKWKYSDAFPRMRIDVDSRQVVSGV